MCAQCVQDACREFENKVHVFHEVAAGGGKIVQFGEQFLQEREPPTPALSHGERET